MFLIRSFSLTFHCWYGPVEAPNHQRKEMSQVYTTVSSFARRSNTTSIQKTTPLFALSPALVSSDFIDYDSNAGATIHAKATEKLSVEFDCSDTSLKVVLESLSDRSEAQDCSPVLMIPVDIKKPREVKDLLTQYDSIDLEHVQAHASTYIKDETRVAQASMNLYFCIMASLSTEVRQKLMLCKEEYTVDGIRSGPCLLKVLSERVLLGF
jgi:hypothetical protein